MSDTVIVETQKHLYTTRQCTPAGVSATGNTTRNPYDKHCLS